MRGVVFIIIFFSLLFLVFKRPYVGILMWFWISLMNPHRMIYGFATGINYAMIVAIVTLGSWLFLHPEESRMPPRDRTTFLFLALMIWITITTLISPAPFEGIWSYWLEAEKILLMTVVAYAMTTTRERFDQLVLVCVLSLAFHGFHGGIIAILHGGSWRVFGPPKSMIADNNDVGVALTMVLPLLIYLKQRYTQPYLKWPMIGLIGMTALGDLFTYSRAALLAISSVAFTFWLRSRQKLLIGILIVIAIIGVFQFAPARWFERMQTIQNYEQDGSAMGRLALWRMAWYISLKYPLTGAGFRWGYDLYWVNTQIAGSGLPPLTKPRTMHSIWFNMLSNHGFIGLALFVGFFVWIILDTRWLIRQTRGRPDLDWANKFARMLQVSLVGYGVGASFANLEMYDGFYVLVIMGAAARRIVAAELAARERAPVPQFAPAVATPSTPATVPVGQTVAPTPSSSRPVWRPGPRPVGLDRTI
jgi:putative inorganic carbon (HCO3(-)) transporter